MADVPGVPPLLNPIVTATGPLLTADAPGIFPGANTEQWGFFLNGVPAITAQSVVSHEFKEEFALSDYPVEQGGFETFDKVYIPFDGRFRFVAGESRGNREALIASVRARVRDLNFYDIVTPEAVFQSANLTHFDYKRTAVNGLGLLIVDVWALEVRVNAGTTQSNTQQPSGADQVNGGTVTPTAATPNQNAVIPVIVQDSPTASRRSWTWLRDRDLTVMQIVPLQAVPNQTVAAQLGGQLCQINVYQKATGLYLDLFVNNVMIIGGVLGENLNRIVRSLYLGFSGDLAFIDNQGSSDPVFSGLGADASSRFNLLYLAASELPVGEG